MRAIIVIIVSNLLPAFLTANYNFSIRIGSLFDNVDSVLSSDISQVLDSINNSSSLLPDTRLDLHTVYTQHGEMLSVYQGVCSQLEHSVVSLVTSPGLEEADTVLVTSLLNRWHLPHFSTQIAPGLTRARNPYTVYLGPSTESLVAAVISATKVTMKPMGRDRRAALVTHHSGLLDTGSVVAQLQEDNMAVQIELLQNKDVRSHMKRIREWGAKTVIVDIAVELINNFLYQALQAALLTPETNLIFTALDFPSMTDLDSVSFTGVTMMSFSLVNPSSPPPPALSDVLLDHRAVLLHDSLVLFSDVVTKLPETPEAQRLNCSDPDTVYSAGEGLVRAIRSHNNNNNNSNIRSEPGHAAITGAISFSPEDGQRDNIQLYLMARRGDKESLQGVFSSQTGQLRLEEDNHFPVGDKPPALIIMGNIQPGQESFVTSLMKSFSNGTEMEIQRVATIVKDFEPCCDTIVTDFETTLQLMTHHHFVDSHPDIIQLKTDDSEDTAEVILILVIFLISFLLVSILLCAISRLSHLHKVSLLDALWVVSTAAFLSIQHNKLASASSKLLILGWILFCLSLLYSILEKYLSRKVNSEQLFIITSKYCEAGNEEMVEYFKGENLHNDMIPPTPSLIIIAATLVGSLLALSLELIIIKVRRSKDDYEVTDSDTAGSDQKLLPWSEERGDRCGDRAL